MLWGRARMAQALATSIRRVELLRRDYPKGKTQCCMFPVLVVGDKSMWENLPTCYWVLPLFSTWFLLLWGWFLVGRRAYEKASETVWEDLLLARSSGLFFANHHVATEAPTSTHKLGYGCTAVRTILTQTPACLVAKPNATWPLVGSQHLHAGSSLSPALSISPQGLLRTERNNSYASYCKTCVWPNFSQSHLGLLLLGNFIFCSSHRSIRRSA